jgi:hypothetical protein
MDDCSGFFESDILSTLLSHRLASSTPSEIIANYTAHADNRNKS